MTDCTYVLANCLHRIGGGQGDVITQRYADIAYPKVEKEETADEIKSRIRDKLEGKWNGSV